ncbi:MAG: DUF4397 domain-containing protein [Mucilaginibacter sp.]
MTGNKAIFTFLVLFVSAVFVLPFVTSCGKTGVVSGASSNTQLQVFNLSPNVGPLDLYANFIKQDQSPYIYTMQGSYFYISPSDTLLQVRTTLSPSVSLISIDTNKGVLKLLSNHKYSLFITGLASSLSYVFTVDDTASTPQSGYGKLRFINTSLQQTNPGLDITANGTLAFSAVKYKAITNYIQLPAGNYNFQINITGASNTILATPGVQTVTIHDGSLYTLYAYGVVGQTDTSAFNAAVIKNR